MLSDLRLACRALARARSFSGVVIVTLALGIGAAAAIFSVADWVLFRANKFPEDVFLVGGLAPQGEFNQWRPAILAEMYEAHQGTVAEWAKGAYQTGNVVLEGRPVATSWAAVSSNLLPMLGVKPVLGRGFLPGEDREGAAQVVILADWFWRQQFGGRPDVLGRRLRVGGSVCTIVGVLAPGTRLPGFLGGPLLRPLTYRVDPTAPWGTNLQMYARLRPGFTREQMQSAVQALKMDSPPPMMKWFFERDRPALAALSELQSGYRVEIYWVMVGAVACLYVIACLNASNLLLLRMLGQRRELSVRLALGASRFQVVRLLWLQAAVLALLGALGAVLIANWVFPLLLRATHTTNAVFGWSSWTLGWRALGVMGGLALVTSFVITALPAMRVLRTDLNSGLKDGGMVVGESRALAWVRGGLVVLQSFFAVVLLAGAGLMIQTFRNFQKVDLGISPVGLVKIHLGFPPEPTQPSRPPSLLRFQAIADDLRQMPGVRAVGFGNDVVLPGFTYKGSAIVTPDGSKENAMFGAFDSGYREAAGLRLVRGRWLDDATRAPEVMVNESLAKALWQERDPIGQVVRHENSDSRAGGMVVVGVVGDVRPSMRNAGPFLYQPVLWNTHLVGSFLIRLDREYDDIFGSAVRRRLYAFDPNLVVHQVQSVSEARDRELWAEHLANSVLTVLAGFALLLTVVGLFSVLAYTVDRRMNEFGVRLALGATRRNLVELVMKRGLALASAGLVAGLGGAVALSRFMQSMLFETSGNDPWVLGGVAPLLIAAAALACLLPARRAARTDVARLLRSE